MPIIKTHLRCRHCRQLLPRDAFDMANYTKKGRQRAPKSTCRECLNGRSKNWHAKRGLIKAENPNPSGLCMCGCGQKTPIATHTRAADNRIAGYPMKYIWGHAIAKSGVHYKIEEDTGCWIWQRSVSNVTRPQMVIWDREMKKTVHYLANRWYYAKNKGDIPDGMELDHLCCNPLCVNPDHMDVVTSQENKARTAKRLRIAGLHWLKTGEIP